MPDPPAVTVPRMYFEFAAYMAVSLAAFTTLETFAKVRANTLTALFAAVAFNIYYWFAAETIVGAVSELAQADAAPLWIWGIRGVVAAVTAVWLARTLLVERRFVALSVATASAPAARLGEGAAVALEKAAHAGERAGVVQAGEQAGRHRARPDAARDRRAAAGSRSNRAAGWGSAAPTRSRCWRAWGTSRALGDDERATLARLGLADNTRLACCARVNGPVTVSLTPQRRAAAPPAAAPSVRFDPAVKRVVVIGHGIAGVTAADHVRRLNPECEVTVVGKEKFPLYNRMGITRLIYGRSAMQGLYLLPDAWYSENKHLVLAEHARGADRHSARSRSRSPPASRSPYDRLILATGSAGYVPTIPGFGAAGTLRAARGGGRDVHPLLRAGHERAARGRRGRRAARAGGGVRAAEARPARDGARARRAGRCSGRSTSAAGAFLREYLAGLGIQVFVESEAARLAVEDGLVKEAVLRDARALPCDVFLVCVGIRPNVALAAEAGPDGGPRRPRRQTTCGRARRTCTAAGDAAEFARRALRPVAGVRGAGRDRGGERGGRRHASTPARSRRRSSRWSAPTSPRSDASPRRRRTR